MIILARSYKVTSEGAYYKGTYMLQASIFVEKMNSFIGIFSLFLKKFWRHIYYYYQFIQSWPITYTWWETNIYVATKPFDS